MRSVAIDRLEVKGFRDMTVKKKSLNSAFQAAHSKFDVVCIVHVLLCCARFLDVEVSRMAVLLDMH